MQFDEARFWAECLNALLEDELYVACYRYESRPAVEIMVEKFEHALAYPYDNSTEGFFMWNDSRGIHGSLRDVQVDLDADRFQVNMAGKTRGGETCWRSLQPVVRGNYKVWLVWMERSWELQR